MSRIKAIVRILSLFLLPLLLGIGSCVLEGCQIRSMVETKLHKGMTQKEVRRLMGNPIEVQSESSTEGSITKWFYSEKIYQRKIFSSYYDRKIYELVFNNEILENIRMKSSQRIFTSPPTVGVGIGIGF